MGSAGDSGDPGVVTVLLVEDLRAHLDIRRTFLGRHEVRILSESPDGPVPERVVREHPHLVLVDVEPTDRAAVHRTSGAELRRRDERHFTTTPATTASRATPR